MGKKIRFTSLHFDDSPLVMNDLLKMVLKKLAEVNYGLAQPSDNTR